VPGVDRIGRIALASFPLEAAPEVKAPLAAREEAWGGCIAASGEDLAGSNFEFAHRCANCRFASRAGETEMQNVRAISRRWWVKDARDPR